MKKIYGVILAIASATAFGFIPVLAKIAYSRGVNPITVVFLRFLFASVMLYGYLKLRNLDCKINKSQMLRLFFTGVFGYGGTGITLFLSYRYISAGMALAFHFIYPSIVALLSFVLYKEKLGLSKIAALAMSMAGIYVLTGRVGGQTDMMGVILAAVSGVLYALYMLEIGREDIKKIHGVVLTFYICIFSTLGIGVYGVLGNELDFHMEFYSVIAILGIALIGTVFAVVAFSLAVQIIGPADTAILSTFEPVTGILFGVLFLNEKLSLSMILGSLLIIASTLVFVLQDRPQKDPDQPSLAIKKLS